MNNKKFYIPDDWMIGNIQLSVFLKLEKTNNTVIIQNHCFVSKEIDFRNRNCLSYLIGDTEVLGTKTNESNLLFSPSGVFYSIDEFLLNGISISDNTIHISIDYIWIENQDGDPFNIVPVFFIPLNNTITKYRKLVASFNAKKKDFYTGSISKHENVNIPSISVEFLKNNQ